MSAGKQCSNERFSRLRNVAAGEPDQPRRLLSRHDASAADTVDLCVAREEEILSEEEIGVVQAIVSAVAAGRVGGQFAEATGENIPDDR